MLDLSRVMGNFASALAAKREPGPEPEKRLKWAAAAAVEVEHEAVE